MSASVSADLVSAKKPHPAMKLSLVVALLVVVVLGLPREVLAGQPSVQAPTGTQSGGVFTSAYAFATYISCVSGPSYNSSYSNALDGTHTFTFKGAPDGSLLVQIDGGGLQLLNSCGDPFAPPAVTVATYTVTYSVSGPPPTPTPTPNPTPTPTPVHTPTPAPGSGGTSGGGPVTGGVTPRPTTNASGKPTPSPSPGITPTPTPSVGPAGSVTSGTPSPTSTMAPSLSTESGVGARLAPSGLGLWRWVIGLLALAGLGGLGRLAWRSRWFRQRWFDIWLRLRLAVGPYWLRSRLKLQGWIRVAGHEQPRARGLSPHHHSGKLLAHHHTSYPALAFLILVSSVLLGAYSMSSQAADTTLSLTVLGPPPTTAATIDQPVDGDRSTVATMTVRGTCPIGIMVEAYRNGSFAGSAFCDGTGLYNILITLVPDQNDIMVRVVDGLGQYGPDSATVTVYYDVPPPPVATPTPSPVAIPAPPVGSASTPKPKPSSTPSAAARTPQSTTSSQLTTAPFLLETKLHSYTGLEVGENLSWPVTLKGGTSPYQIDWDWGDGSKQSLNLATAGEIAPSHSYRQGGTFRVIIRVHDRLGREAAMTLVAIVNGAPASVGSVGRDQAAAVPLTLLWPILGATSLVVMSFWLGERHRLTIWRSDADPKPA